MNMRPNVLQTHAYVSGGISGQVQLARVMFNAVAQELRGLGWKHVFNPIEVDGELGLTQADCVFGSGKSRSVVLANDCRWICENKPVLFVLPNNYRKSTGCMMEISVSKALGLPIKYLRKKKGREIMKRRINQVRGVENVG